MANNSMMKSCSELFDSLPEDKRDGLSHEMFMKEVKRLLDPKANAKVLDGMIEMRAQQRMAREEKARIDRAVRNAEIGLR